MIDGLRLEGLSLTVDDVERSLAFYRDMLKLEVVYATPPAFALLRLGAVSIGLLSGVEAAKEGVVSSSPDQRRGVHVEFTTDNLDGLYATLLGSGVKFLEPPHEVSWSPPFGQFGGLAKVDSGLFHAASLMSRGAVL